MATSSDDELSDWAKEKMVDADKMIASFDSVDRRLLSILDLRRDRRTNNDRVRRDRFAINSMARRENEAREGQRRKHSFE